MACMQVISPTICVNSSLKIVYAVKNFNQFSIFHNPLLSSAPLCLKNTLNNAKNQNSIVTASLGKNEALHCIKQSGFERIKELKLFSLSGPALMLAFVEAELPEGIDIITLHNQFAISEPFLKAFYMIFACIFCWGAVVFASMNDPYYDSDEYRNAGGNGTQYWMYAQSEAEEEESREELWKEEFLKEIEEKVADVKELEATKEADKVKELV